MKKASVLRVTVERESATGAYFASWDSPEGDGISGYSATPIGALANALHTMILIAEDRVRDRQVSSERTRAGTADGLFGNTGRD